MITPRMDRPAETPPKYIIITLSDAKAIACHLPAGPVRDRMEAEEGADIEEIVRILTKLDTCHACDVEGQQRYCMSLVANKLGRRIRRLIGRANGTWPQKDEDET